MITKNQSPGEDKIQINKKLIYQTQMTQLFTERGITGPKGYRAICSLTPNAGYGLNNHRLFLHPLY